MYLGSIEAEASMARAMSWWVMVVLADMVTGLRTQWIWKMYCIREIGLGLM